MYVYIQGIRIRKLLRVDLVQIEVNVRYIFVIPYGVIILHKILISRLRKYRKIVEGDISLNANFYHIR